MLLEEELWILSSLPIMGHCAKGVVYGKIVIGIIIPIVSEPLLLTPVCSFLICLMRRRQSASF